MPRSQLRIHTASGPDPMIALGIDTCGAKGSIGLARIEGEDVRLLGQTELAGKTYSAQLVSALEALLLEDDLQVTAIQAVVVVNGPGSFTGVRIGVSSAKGLAEALEIPVLAISRLAVLAWKAGAESSAMDAGRKELYLRDGSREYLSPAESDSGSRSGSWAVFERELLPFFPGAVLVDPPTAEDALKFAAPRLTAGEFADITRLDGNYLRRSDAELFAKTEKA